MMNKITYEVDGWNNFCRVFQLPKKFSSEFCFGGGIPTQFLMVDWFYPVPEVNNAAVTKEVWLKEVGPIKVKTVTIEELYDSLVPFLVQKRYVLSGYQYIVICDFGAVIWFTKDSVVKLDE